jgi:uncharacterized membrane protein YbhN (UPF0104 family)
MADAAPMPPLEERPRAGGGRRAALGLLKFLCGVGLVALLFQRQNIRWPLIADAGAQMARQPLWMAATLLLVLGCLLCGAARWRLALRGLGVKLTARRTAALFMAGHFFNGFLPGTTGGDVARAIYAARETPNRPPEAVMSIVVERLAGVVVLLLLTLGGLLALAARGRPHLTLALLTLGAASVALLSLLLALPEARHFAEWPLARRLERHPTIGPLARRLYAALRVCRTHPRLTWDLLAWSLLQHGCAVASWVTLAAGIGAPFRLPPYLSLMPAVLTAQMLPLTPGGLGVREGAACVLLPLAGMPAHQATVVALASFAVSLLWSAVGGLFFVALREAPLRQK